MFYLLCIVATIGYSLQAVLMAGVYRRCDRLSAVTYRGLCLGVTMSPLLLIPNAEMSPARVPLLEVIVPTTGAAVLAFLGNWSLANAYHRISISLATASYLAQRALFVSVLGYVVLHETLSPGQIALGGLLVVLVAYFAYSQRSAEFLAAQHLGHGLLASTAGAICLGGAFFIIGAIAREAHPLHVAYAWETGIGVVGLIVLFMRKRLGYSGLKSLGSSWIVRIALYSSPTIIGTSAYAYAAQFGPIAIATIILSAVLVCNALFAQLFFGERLNKLQWMIAAATCALLAAFRFFSVG